jgi:hypothetical protein
VSDIDEVVSPNTTKTIQTDADIEILYRQLGQAMMQVKTLELTIQRKLGLGG